MRSCQNWKTDDFFFFLLTRKDVVLSRMCESLEGSALDLQGVESMIDFNTIANVHVTVWSSTVKSSPYMLCTDSRRAIRPLIGCPRCDLARCSLKPLRAISHAIVRAQLPYKTHGPRMYEPWSFATALLCIFPRRSELIYWTCTIYISNDSLYTEFIYPMA